MEKENKEEVRLMDGDMFDRMFDIERQAQEQVKKELAEEAKQEEEKEHGRLTMERIANEYPFYPGLRDQMRRAVTERDQREAERAGK